MPLYASTYALAAASAVAAVLTTSTAFAQDISPPGLIGAVATPFRPAFLQIHDQTLFISSFDPKGTTEADNVNSAPITSTEFDGSFATADITVVGGSTQMTWPNVVSFAPKGTLGQDNVMSVGTGFILNGKKGAMYVSYPDVDAGENSEGKGLTYRISPEINKYFYHKGVWADMNGDGVLDIVTTRSTFSVPPFWRSKGQVVWFENPNKPLAEPLDVTDLGPWEERFIDDGNKRATCDVDLLLHDFNDDGIPEIVCTHFFDTKALVFDSKDPSSINIYSTSAADGWKSSKFGSSAVTKTKIVLDIGAPFGVELVDVNGDGILDIVTGNHESEGKNSLVAVFTQPASGDFKDASGWTQHTIVKGFTNLVKDGMSPGGVQMFHPTKASKVMKPWVVIAGDGDGRVHVLVPESEDASNFEYNHAIIFDTLASLGTAYTTGAIALNEGDDCTKLYVPVYEANSIAVFDGCKLEQEITFLPEGDDVTQRAPEGVANVVVAGDDVVLKSGLAGAGAAVAVCAAAAVVLGIVRKNQTVAVASSSSATISKGPAEGTQIDL